MLHGPASDLGVDKASDKKAKLGIVMFFIYTAVYIVFVIICLTVPEMMGVQALGAQNLAIVFGFGLIALAVVMGFIYHIFCTKYEDKMNKN